MDAAKLCKPLKREAAPAPATEASDDKKKKKGSGATRCCQADRCTVDLTDAKQYHKRHRVCEYHSKAQVVLVSAIRQRFCQQCSRFHELAEFDDTRRSCRRRLAGHNERRRKNFDSQSEAPNRKGQVRHDHRGRIIQKTMPENNANNYKQFPDKKIR